MKRNQLKMILLFCTYLSSLISSPYLYAEQTTTVFKVVNPDGSVSYSDQPQQNAIEMKISPISTVPAFSLPSDSYPNASKNQKTDIANTYYSMKISAPSNNSAFYSGSGDVDIIVELIPPLSSGDQFEFQLDGSTIATSTNRQYTLKTLDRGTHMLNINVINTAGKMLKNASSTFTVHRPIKRP